jgi:hypothetical protein
MTMLLEKCDHLEEEKIILRKNIEECASLLANKKTHYNIRTIFW